jgi:hypothetical protein
MCLHFGQRAGRFADSGLRGSRLALGAIARPLFQSMVAGKLQRYNADCSACVAVQMKKGTAMLNAEQIERILRGEVERTHKLYKAEAAKWNSSCR